MAKVLRNVAVYCGATLPPAQVFQDAAREMGACLARRQIGLVYGGTSEGTMKLVAEAALDNGGKVIGVFPDNLPQEWLQPGLTEVVRTHTLAKTAGVLNVAGFYDDLLRFIEHSFQTGFTTEQHRHLLKAAETPEELLQLLEN